MLQYGCQTRLTVNRQHATASMYLNGLMKPITMGSFLLVEKACLVCIKEKRLLQSATRRIKVQLKSFQNLSYWRIVLLFISIISFLYHVSLATATQIVLYIVYVENPKRLFDRSALLYVTMMQKIIQLQAHVLET